jgi:hypothetical protein
LAFNVANEISSTEQIDHEILALHACTARCGGTASGVTARFWPVSCRFYWRALFTASSILPPNLFLTVFGQFAVQSIVKIRRCI